MHPDKSKIVYCKDSNRNEQYPHVSFTFLGFTFRVCPGTSSGITKFSEHEAD
jgi:hypothetical protein